MTSEARYTRAEVCAVACAEAFRGDGEILASPMGWIPSLGARLAQRTFSPALVLSDGIAHLVQGATRDDLDGEPVIEGWLPYRAVFDVVWSGRRHVMMGASQIDRFGNQNISCVGDWAQPKSQLLGVRGAPGNTIHHPTSYWVPRHSPRVFVEKVDVVCGVGYDRARELGEQAARFHEIRCVVSNLGVFDFETADRSMRLKSRHPGVSAEEIQDQTGFALSGLERAPETRSPIDEELRILRSRLDPESLAAKEVPS